jgi:uncharacterized membrane protein
VSKEAFLSELRSRLNGLPQEDIEDRVQFYAEMIDDRMEDGLSEADAVANIGSIDTIVSQIMSEIPLSRIVKTKTAGHKKLSGAAIALLVITSVVWVPLLMAGIIVFASVYVALWAVVVALIATCASMYIGGVGVMIGSAVFFSQGNAMAGVFYIGAGIALIGCGMIMTVIVWLCIKGVIKLGAAVLLGVKKLLIGGNKG